MAGQTYRIGEAADILQLKSYVLRFWETEFTQLAPLRTDKGQRLYTEAHLDLLRRIRHLLHEQGMTIDGARRVLAAEQRHGRPGVPAQGAEAAGLPGATPPADSASTVSAPAPASASVPAGADPGALRLVRDELLELRNLLLSQ